jgi:Spx/MgsR family transcriptional regulator
MEEQNVEFEFIDLKKEPFTRSELKDLELKVGLDVVVNKRGRTWRDLGLADKDLSDKELFDVLLKNQTMIKRPVLLNEESVLVGYDEESFEAFTAEEEDQEEQTK